MQKISRGYVLAWTLGIAGTWVGAQASVLYNNGGMVTDVGGGFNGADVSRASTTFTTLAIGSTTSSTSITKVADDFTVPAGGWNIASITGFPCMQTTTALPYSFPPTSPIQTLTFEIYDGVPGLGGNVIASSTTILSNTWAGLYRTSNTAPLTATLPVMAAEADFGGLFLDAGNYWAAFTYTGHAPNNSTAVATPLVMTVDGSGNPVTVNGNGRAYTQNGQTGIWSYRTGGNPLQGVEFPFIVNGTAVPAPASLVLVLGLCAQSRRKR